MFKLYYQHAATQDQLSYLTDSEIKDFIRDSPSKLKRRMKKLLTLLDKYEITLLDSGEVTWGNAPKTIVNKLKDDPMVFISKVRYKLLLWKEIQIMNFLTMNIENNKLNN